MASESLSVIQICNMALTQLGEPSISSLAEKNKASRLCDLRYIDVRNAVLRAHPWNCAIKRASLAQLNETPAYGYAYAFQLPTDFLRLVRPQVSSAKYKIEGRKVLTNESEFNLTYIYALDDVTQMDSLLQAAIAARLAAELALPLARSAERQNNLWQQYKEKLSEARFIDASEHEAEVLQTDHWLGSRIGLHEDPYRRIESP